MSRACHRLLRYRMTPGVRAGGGDDIHDRSVYGIRSTIYCSLMIQTFLLMRSNYRCENTSRHIRCYYFHASMSSPAGAPVSQRQSTGRIKQQ